MNEACYNVYNSLETGNQILGLSNLPNLAEWLLVKNLNVMNWRQTSGHKTDVQMYKQ